MPISAVPAIFDLTQNLPIASAGKRAAKMRPASEAASASYRYLHLVPVLSIVVYLVHVREFYGEHFFLGLFYVLAFGIAYVEWIWGCYLVARRWLMARTGDPAADFGFRGRSLLIGLTAISGLYVAQALCGIFFEGTGAPPKPIGVGPFFATNATIFLIVSAFGNYRERLAELKTATLEAQYSTLKSQLRPHFLFNALNSLSELIENGNSAEAAAMTQKLSDLYRQILRNSKSRTSPLSSELDIVARYLEIERLRFEERVRFSVEAPANADKIYVPSLMLQTLVENAVKHGIAPSLAGGEIAVAVKALPAGGFLASVENSGKPYDAQPVGKNTPLGTGLRNTRERLGLLYGPNSDFQIRGILRTDEQGSRRTAVTFRFTGVCLDER